MNFEKLNELIETTEKRKALEAEVKLLKEREQQLNDELIPMFEESDAEKITIHGKTLFIKRQLWAALEEGFEHEDGVRALKAAGFNDLVAEKYDSRVVSAFFREREKKVENNEIKPEDLIPKEMRGVFRTSEKFSIGIVKA